MAFSIKQLGPGFLFAGAAIGVSHLVQSTRAGADFGFGLLWALLLINVIKYPFFQIGTRYATATGETLLHAYRNMGRGVLVAYFLLTFATMFTIQTAVTVVTAGIATSLFEGGTIVLWTAIITALCTAILIIGKYKVLDHLMKFIVVGLTLSTIVAVCLAIQPQNIVSLQQIVPKNAMEIGFLITFMGWMPAPLDISIWQSIWTVEKQKTNKVSVKQSLFDFNVGYVLTIILAISFLALGTFVMFNSGETFSSKAGEFSNQLIAMYTSSLGESAQIIIGIAALTTMFSTTLTTLDASPRVMQRTSEILTNRTMSFGYLFWLSLLALGTLLIFFFFLSEMGTLIYIATVLSFITAPFYAIINYKAITSKAVALKNQPGIWYKTYCVVSISILIAFSIWYVTTLF